jgi:cell division protein FtsI (penicillin-binding protein 3)
MRRSSPIDILAGSDGPDGAFEQTWRHGVKHRALLLLGLIGLWVLALEGRLLYMQLLEHEWYVVYAERQQLDRVALEAPRGDILDRNGRLLAYSAQADAIVANPRAISDPEKTVAALCRALGDCDADERRELVRRLKQNKSFAYIRRPHAVALEQLERVAALNLPHVRFEPEPRRFYPNSDLAAHVLGFVDVDNRGQAGLEYAYEKVLAGHNGRALIQVDGLQQRVNSRVDVEPIPGGALELTIDTTLQHIVERELEAGVKANRAKGGMAVVMQPHTGEILALASYPTFNPNSPRRFAADARRNRAVQDVYEPGSTFKIITAAAALEESVVRPHEMIDTGPGHITIGKRKPIRDTHNYGILSFEDVIVKSSNVGSIKVAWRLGPELFSRYVHRFGFGQKLAPDFPGQSEGLWNPKLLDESGLASVAMGYQVSVTPVQMAAAVSAIANGGRLMEPRVVRAVERDGRRVDVQPRVLRQTVSPTTARVLMSMLEGVVERGTALEARIPGYRLAGKTGTASKVIGGAYSETDYNASFVGFAPAREPAFTILVVIDTPRAGSFYGGRVAAPVFRRIAEAALQRSAIGPTEDAQPIVIQAGTSGRLPRVRTTSVLPTVIPAGGAAVMPDLHGLAAREVVRTMSDAGLMVRVSGAGFVARQMPQPGAPIQPGRWAVVELQRRPVDETRIGDVR